MFFLYCTHEVSQIFIKTTYVKGINFKAYSYYLLNNRKPIPQTLRDLLGNKLEFEIPIIKFLKHHKEYLMSQFLKNISNAECLFDRTDLVIFPLFSC